MESVGIDVVDESERILYHYTSGHALIQILSTRDLWATHLAYMNDRAEFRHAFRIAREIIERTPALQDAGKRFPGLEALICESEPPVGGRAPHIYAVCFSELQDSLSQWRGYTKHGDGYVLEVRAERLRKLAAAADWRLERVLYGVDADRQVQQAVTQAFDGRAAGTYPTDEEAYDALLTDLVHRGPRLKSQEFAEEREWRLISPDLGYWSRVEWRAGPHSLVPYTKFSLGTAPDLDLVIGVSPGPNREPELATEALLMMINQLGYHIGAGLNGSSYRGH